MIVVGGFFVHLARLWGGEPVFINELHYDNTSVDQGEGVEIAGKAGTDLSDYRLVFFNGNGGSIYKQFRLTGVIDNEEGSGAGAVWFGVSGIQNGAPDGIALVKDADGQMLEFLSYEGAMSIPGVGISVDIGLAEGGRTRVGDSLQRIGRGSRGEDFGWSGPVAGSPGQINAGQVIEAEVVDQLILEIEPSRLSEAGGVAAATVRLVPAEEGEILLTVAPSAEISAPSRVEIGASGAATFEISGVADGLTDGDQRIVVSAVVPGDGRRARAEVIVEDVDTPDLRMGAFRVATCNLKNGAGVPGSPAHEALLSVLRRVDADVIAFQEASDAGDFANLKALVGGLGFGVTREFLATEGDAFEGQGYDGGDFGSGQVLALASRARIVETVQIGRGAPGAEMTRFPLYVAVDVDGVPPEFDPHFVVVHYKAGSTDADRFRKAVEGYRTTEFLAGRGLDGRISNVFVLGDFNEDVNDFQPAGFDTGINPSTHLFGDGSDFPASYRLGADLQGINARSLSYAPFPRLMFRAAGLRVFDALQVDGADRTRNDFSPRRLDYILHPGLAERNGNVWQEVFNGDLEPVSAGLPKVGPPVRKGESRDASDHHVVFGDFELAERPSVSLEVGEAYRAEGDFRAVPMVVRGGGAREVRIVARPVDEVRLGQEVVTFAEGEEEKVIEVFVLGDRVADPDVGVVLSGSADGFSTGYDDLVVRNVEASGRVIVSQYHEPSSGSALKALEIMNVSGETIDFYSSPLEVRLYGNGSADYSVDALVEEGVLRDGGVVVIGDAATGDYLVDEGVIEDPVAAWSSFFSGTAFPGANGDAAFVIEPLNFNGDDALEVLVDRVRADVIGRTGEDPGVAWTDGGSISTSGQNLGRLPWAVRGSGGWNNPGLRFDRVAGGNSLVGFGIPPSLEDRYGIWADGFGAGGVLDDDDGDGSPNLWEYASNTSPVDGRRFSVVEIELGDDSLSVGVPRRPGAEELVYSVEVSMDGVDWEPGEVRQFSTSEMGGGLEAAVWTLDSSGVRFVRLRVEIL